MTIHYFWGSGGKQTLSSQNLSNSIFSYLPDGLFNAPESVSSGAGFDIGIYGLGLGSHGSAGSGFILPVNLTTMQPGWAFGFKVRFIGTSPTQTFQIVAHSGSKSIAASSLWVSGGNLYMIGGEAISQFPRTSSIYLEFVLNDSFNFDLYLDNVKIENFVNLTLDRSNFRICGSAFSGTLPGGEKVMQYDDFYIADERLGPQKVIYREPTADIVNNWSPTTGSSNATILARSDFATTSYITSPESELTDIYSSNVEIDDRKDINAVRYFAYVSKTQANERNLIFVDGARESQPVQTFNGYASVFSQIYETMPDGSPLSKVGLEALQFGMYAKLAE